MAPKTERSYRQSDAAIPEGGAKRGMLLNLIPANPVPMVKVAARSVSDRQAKYLTIEEVMALLKVSRGSYLGDSSRWP